MGRGGGAGDLGLESSLLVGRDRGPLEILCPDEERAAQRLGVLDPRQQGVGARGSWVEEKKSWGSGTSGPPFCPSHPSLVLSRWKLGPRRRTSSPGAAASVKPQAPAALAPTISSRGQCPLPRVLPPGQRAWRRPRLLGAHVGLGGGPSRPDAGRGGVASARHSAAVQLLTPGRQPIGARGRGLAVPGRRPGDTRSGPPRWPAREGSLWVFPALVQIGIKTLHCSLIAFRLAVWGWGPGDSEGRSWRLESGSPGEERAGTSDLLGLQEEGGRGVCGRTSRHRDFLATPPHPHPRAHRTLEEGGAPM